MVDKIKLTSIFITALVMILFGAGLYAYKNVQCADLEAQIESLKKEITTMSHTSAGAEAAVEEITTRLAKLSRENEILSKRLAEKEEELVAQREMLKRYGNASAANQRHFD